MLLVFTEHDLFEARMPRQRGLAQLKFEENYAVISLSFLIGFYRS